MDVKKKKKCRTENPKIHTEQKQRALARDNKQPTTHSSSTYNSLVFFADLGSINSGAMSRLTENDQELKDILDGVMINDCIKPFRRVSEKLEELGDFAEEYCRDTDMRINQMLLSLRKDEMNTLKLEMRLEKILELVTGRMWESRHEEKREEKRNQTTKQGRPHGQEAEERTMSSSVNSMESVQVDPLIKRTLEQERTQRKIYGCPEDAKGLSMQVEEETCDGEISVNISTDGSARSLLSKYIHGENRDGNEVREKDPNAVRRRKVDGIKRTVKPLVREDEREGGGKCCGLWKRLCCCLSEKGPTRSGKYYKMTTQEWKDFLASIEPKDKKYKSYCTAMEKRDDSYGLGIEGLPPLVVEYSSLNAPTGQYYYGSPMYGNMSQYQQYYYYYGNNSQGCYNGQYYYDARSQASNASFGNNNTNHVNYRQKGRGMQEDVKRKQKIHTQRGAKSSQKAH